MASDAASLLIRRLETSNYQNILQDFSNYLKPFSDFINFDLDRKKKNKKKTKPDPIPVPDQKLIRPLAKKFLPFISPALKLLPTRLTELHKSDSQTKQEVGRELFEVYKLCLECLGCISSCLEGKVYSIYFQRMRLVWCYEVWGLFLEAETEGFSILERVGGGNKVFTTDGKVGFLPEIGGETEDPELGSLVVEVVASIVKCSFKSGRKEDGVYQRVIELVDQVKPWLRVLESKDFERLTLKLVNHLYECTRFMLADDACFNDNSVHWFCMTTLTECLKSRKDQFYKIARNVCSLLSSQWAGSSLILEVLKCVLDSITEDCKVGVEENVNECFDIVHYCLRKCRLSSADSCRYVGQCLEKLASELPKVLIPIDSILRVYAAGLCLSEDDSRLSCCSLDDLLITFSSHSGDLLCLTNTLHSLASYFHDSTLKYKRENGRVSFVSYLNALAFFCHPPAELINKAGKFLAESISATNSSNMIYILDAFQHFCDAFLIRFSWAFEREREKFGECQNTLIYVAKAALIISLRTDKNVEKSIYHIDCIMSSWWIQLKEMNFLIASLYNIGADLYNTKKVKKAAVAFELCCRSAWSRVSLVCNKFITKSEAFHEDWSEEAIARYVKEACSRSVALLDVLHRSESSYLHSSMLSALLNWSVAAKLFEDMDGLTALVKQWAKTTCKDYVDVNVDDSDSGVPLLYSLLCGSPTLLDKRTIGIILEQELLAYEEMEARNVNLCQGLQLKIIDILLQNVYDTGKDFIVQKSTILIKQGRICRVAGINGLKKCIQCLSEAISTLIDVPSEDSTIGSPASHQLAVAYCLRALCAQETQSNSEDIFPDSSAIEKKIMDDIHCALKLWYTTDWSVDVHHALVIEDIIQLLCCIADLLSAKGYFHLHYDIYQLIIILLEKKNIPLEKCFAMLWADRRLVHTFCTTPIDGDVGSRFAQQFNVSSDRIGFWINCIKDSEPLLVGFRQKFDLYGSILPEGDHCYSGGPLGSVVTVDKVKDVASSLISSASVTSSTFLVGHLYYDLCERLLLSGHHIKALSFAREALRLRTKLLQKKFICNFGKQHENTSESAGTSHKLDYDCTSLVVFGSVATEVWPPNRSWNVEQCNLSQWNVLQCYLDSILQVGTIHEALGNASVAEVLLLLGESISSMERLPVFQVAFSSALGEIYCKMQLWDLAVNKLKSAKQILVDSSTTISCKRCKLTLEVTVDQRIGDLVKNCSDKCTRESLLDSFSAALDLYSSALNKINIFKSEISFSFSEEIIQLDNKAHCSQKVENKDSLLTMESKRSKRTSVHLPKETNSKQPNLRMTRSRNRSSQTRSVQVQGEVGSDCIQSSSANRITACPTTRSSSKLLSEQNPLSITEVGCGNNCWKCLLVRVIETGNMQDFAYMKWESQRRRLLLGLLDVIGKWFADHDEVSKMHEILWQSISMLFNRAYVGPHPLLLELIGKDSQGDSFAIEHASILYNLSWFSLKNIHSRIACCELSRVQLHSILSWLLQAFMLSRETPLLFQKVSRLLTTVYLASVVGGPLCIPLYPGETLSRSHWAAFFHQASLGTYFNHQLCANPNGARLFNTVDYEGSHMAATTEGLTDVSDLLRLAPGKIDDLEKFVIEFFRRLPSITIVCISSLGSEYACLLRDVLPGYFSSPALTLLSRLNSDMEPVVILLPSDVIPEDLDNDAKLRTSHPGTDTKKKWVCPWGCTAVDTVAPQFKSILEENYLSSLYYPTVDTEEHTLQWWTRRRKLNDRLDKFVRGIEEYWLGPWKCLLLGEPLIPVWLDSVLSKMISALKCKFSFSANESLLRIILGGATSVSEIEECISQLLMHKGCLTRWGSFPDKKSDFSSTVCLQAESLPGKLLHQMIEEATSELKVECINREAIVLVLDSDVQMLPWETLPVLRKYEVYRMPSVGSISALINGNIHRQVHTERVHRAFPSIDPLDAFYLLNPSGDLDCTQVEFEEWFIDQKLEGKAGSPPPVEELVLALKHHDLFIYFGHGSGTQYIPGHEIQKLDSCAATLLMGCASGSLPFIGCYNPQGAVLFYLLAGSPAIIANLWEVTDKDIDRFGKTMLKAWLQERSTPTNGCKPVNLVEEFESMNIGTSGVNDVTKTNGRSKNDSSSTRCNGLRGHRPSIASFMSQAREACKLPFLVGAAPVCYGVPTGIRRREKKGL